MKKIKTMTITTALIRSLRITLIIACFGIYNSGQAQYWDEIGTTWTYHVSEPGGFSTVSISILADTIVNGINAKFINGNCACCLAATEFIYEEGGKVYRHDSETDQFHLLYDFTAGKGDSWDVYLGVDYTGVDYGTITFTVDSIRTIMFDNKPYEVQYIHDETFSAFFGNYIIKGIGSPGGMFPENGICHWPNPLRCYDSPSIGTINVSSEVAGWPEDIACDSTYVYVPVPVENISGHVFEDFDFDCLKDPFENLGHEGWTVMIENLVNTDAPSYQMITGADGYYSFSNPEDYLSDEAVKVSFIEPTGSSQLCCSHCDAVKYIDLFGNLSLTVDHGIFCELDAICSLPIMDVAIATNWIRPCFDGEYWINYCNTGCETAEDAYLEVQIDEGLTIVESSIPWSAQDGNLLTFELGDVESDDCERFSITFNAPCSGLTGTNYCSSVYAYPDSTCLPATSQWDGSEIELSGLCLEDSIRFTIKNIGSMDMDKALDYIIIEDNVLYPPVTFQLMSGEALVITLPLNGYYYQILALQPDGFPGAPIPTFWIEGCDETAEVNVGIVNQYPLGDDDPWYDVYCRESVNSYDPNDKTGYPTGVGPNHSINQNVALDYVIRFENEGTAEALYIEIRDTIPTDLLDPTSVRPGASSHPYQWDMQENGIVVFKFYNIDLPATSQDPNNSNGFVQFKVDQYPHLPIGTEILNTAAIYFDNNPPVITNQTMHTIGEDYFTSINDPFAFNSERLQVKINPNPFHDQLAITVPEFNNYEVLQIEFFDTLGKRVFTKTFKNGESIATPKHLPSGVYFYQLATQAGEVVAGKLIKS